MKNWTDKIINWNQLPGTEVRRLIATWGMSPVQIARYDAKHGYATSPAAEPVKAETKAVPAKKVASKKVVQKATQRQKHTGADGEIKFVEHRNLYVGFWGGKVVVTKRTKEACLEVLRKNYNFEA